MIRGRGVFRARMSLEKQHMVFITVIQFALIVAVVVYLALNALHLARAEPTLGKRVDAPFVSVCVPARDEARDIGNCLKSLLRQDYPRFEVIAVDDNSTDATPEIIRALAGEFPNLRFVGGTALPADWCGKPFALHQAHRISKGEYLLFTDADPVFKPFALSSAMLYMQSRNLDVLTLMPGAEFGSFWERAVQPVIFALIAAMSRFKKINSRDYPDAMGIGAFILIRREVYERIGGHERVRREIVEDVALAHCAKQDGFNLGIADGKALFSIRMYHSLREIWIGWRKNIFIALKKSVPRTIYYITVILGFQVNSYLVFLGNVWMESPVYLTGLSLAGLAMVWAAGAELCRELRLDPRNMALFPLGAMVMAAIMVNSMTHVLLKGGAEWRGRTYAQPAGK